MTTVPILFSAAETGPDLLAHVSYVVDPEKLKALAGTDWEFLCTTEKLEDGTVILYCGGCGHSYEYKEEK